MVVIAAALIQAAGDTPAGKAMGAMGLSVAVPDKYKDLVQEAGNTCPEISPNLLAGLLTQESGFNPKAKSPAGAQGIAQFIPSTWEKDAVDGDGDGDRDVWDPKDAIPSAGVHLCKIAKEVKDVPGSKQNNILAAYNAGSGAVVHYGGVPPYRETQNYVKSIGSLVGKMSSGGKKATTTQAVTAVNAANDMVGKPYSWGGGDANGPSTGTCCSPRGRSGKGIKGFDCSGLTLYAYAQAGITLPRTASQQYAASEPVKAGQMRVGDLIFYGKSAESLHHVGIYVGGGHMIDAPRPGTKVRYSAIDSMPDKFGVARPVPNANKEI
ncbi:NlpC/P60 family protein [Streptomyces flavofungini]|uniref:C40 family peptidase n=1 Tax=Streptomyces flavofungini TaxID=68200 RepID=UPI0025B11485|nr:bifunctional lytic transglycosylase/C40 family peptidase [Streptomyces flavofungini]WJV51842.1 bifunctional lytic transglycosylase/C40 family peptidase [Streptomyces flavofungini]WJV51876.1 bifunctional lytic transglycosylase/C40 family peptidase [Streptomyces flavofungini]